MRGKILLTHKFIEFIPRELEANTIYVSIPYATVIHNCCCGCGNRVVTPLSPTDWKLIFDGRSISLEPAIGNWSFACRSHYWIKKNRAVWSDEWADEEVAEARREDVQARAVYYSNKNADKSKEPCARPESKIRRKKRNGLKSNIQKWLGVKTPPDAGPTE